MKLRKLELLSWELSDFVFPLNNPRDRMSTSCHVFILNVEYKLSTGRFLAEVIELFL
ncbi:GSCOCG00005726001-RA-CDS [Cotesia congregata]|nr:GSCOCG00005726001-RA-CDS [Cotesia congregata]